MIRLSVVSGNNLLRQGIISLLTVNSDLAVVSDAVDIDELFRQLNQMSNNEQPEIILIDGKDLSTGNSNPVRELLTHLPSLRIIAIVNEYGPAAVMAMKAGARSCLTYDITTQELIQSIRSVNQDGHYYNDKLVKCVMANLDSPINHEHAHIQLSPREKEFLALACDAREFTYKEIADQMCVGRRTVDNYRESLFEKLNVISRGGMVMYAIKNKLVEQ